MPWKTSGGTYLKEGRSWTDSDGIKHPSNWTIWTDDYKTDTIGLTWEDPLGPFDEFYYWGWNSDKDALLPKPLAGLQSSKVKSAKSEAAILLSKTDWYVVRKSEANTAIPAEITAYRTAIRANYASLRTAINDTSDIAGLQALYVTVAGASSTSTNSLSPPAGALRLTPSTLLQNCLNACP